MINPVWPSSCVTPAGTSNELDVQNKPEENAHTVCYYSSTTSTVPRKNAFFPQHGERSVYIPLRGGPAAASEAEEIIAAGRSR